MIDSASKDMIDSASRGMIVSASKDMIDSASRGMIVSASRRTDIPAYYCDWFFNKLACGAVTVKNPFNPKQERTVSLARDAVDGFVFWSKNPAPMIGRLGLLGGYAYYFQFTLNAYGRDTEPGLPPVADRIATFQKLSELIGPKRVIWRYDPILLSGKYTEEWHAAAFSELCGALRGHAQKVIISFIDDYKAISKRLKENGIYIPKCNNSATIDATTDIINATTDATIDATTDAAVGSIERIAAALAAEAHSAGMSIESCAEEADLSMYGIGHGKCVDASLIAEGRAPVLRKDANQRPACGCSPSVDIGAYGTCPCGCIYCYANHSRATRSMPL